MRRINPESLVGEQRTGAPLEGTPFAPGGLLAFRSSTLVNLAKRRQLRVDEAGTPAATGVVGSPVTVEGPNEVVGEDRLACH